MSDTEPDGAASDLVKPGPAPFASPDLQPEPVAPEPSLAEGVVQAWLQDRIANGPIARDEAAWAQLLGALPDLLTRLAAPQA